MKINKSQTDLSQKEPAAIATKKTWAKPTVELISVESGLRTLFVESTAPLNRRANYHS